MIKRTVLLGITGSIAAYKILELIKLLEQKNIEVFVVMTKSAAKIVNPLEFEKASGNKVFIELFEKGFDYKKVLKEKKVNHIELAKKADLMVVAPATANTIAKLSFGFADDFLTTTALAITCPIIICPAMNVNIWNNPIVQQNISQLKSRGFQIIEPICGELACGDNGKGKLENINIIKNEILKQLSKTASLKGKKIIITAGGTIEKIDEVRFISNRSSGKMGAAIADECFLRGADVLLIRAKNAVKPRFLIKEEVFSTFDDLFELIKKNVKNYEVFFHCAAVSDFQVIEPFVGKIKSNKDLTIKLKPREKIINTIKNFNPKIKLIAFKAEYRLAEEKLLNKAKKTLIMSNASAIIANDVSKTDRGFESDNNDVYVLLSNGKVKHLPLSLKKDIASEIIDFLQII